MTQNQGKIGGQITVHVDENDERFVEWSCCGYATTVRDNVAKYDPVHVAIYVSTHAAMYDPVHMVRYDPNSYV